MAFNPEQSAILKTISHFDVLNIPLTLIEITRFSRLELTAQKTLELLNSQPLNQLISQKNGLYFLNERLEILTLKHERYRLALSKLKRAKISAHLLSRLPWIRAVAIYSSLAFKNSRTDGDIDLFFITAGNRVWSARFFVNSLLTVFNLRPKNNNTKNQGLAHIPPPPCTETNN